MGGRTCVDGACRDAGESDVLGSVEPCWIVVASIHHFTLGRSAWVSLGFFDLAVLPCWGDSSLPHSCLCWRLRRHKSSINQDMVPCGHLRRDYVAVPRRPGLGPCDSRVHLPVPPPGRAPGSGRGDGRGSAIGRGSCWGPGQVRARGNGRGDGRGSAIGRGSCWGPGQVRARGNGLSDGWGSAAGRDPSRGTGNGSG